jgi:DNA-binding HxlR family transcriptional regulator
MVKIIETLRKDPMRFNQLCNETGLARRYVGRYLKELMARGMVAHDA